MVILLNACSYFVATLDMMGCERNELFFMEYIFGSYLFIWILLWCYRISVVNHLRYGTWRIVNEASGLYMGHCAGFYLVLGTNVVEAFNRPLKNDLFYRCIRNKLFESDWIVNREDVDTSIVIGLMSLSNNRTNYG